MAFDTDSTRRGLATVGERFPNPVAALGNFARGARSYMGVSAGFGLVVAVLDGGLVFGTWVIGPLGALLAVPLTLLARALLVEADPRTRRVPLIAGTPAPGKEPESKVAPEAVHEESVR